jgi:hypothetical protein
VLESDELHSVIVRGTLRVLYVLFISLMEFTE